MMVWDKFIETSKGLQKENKEGTCFATLTKENDYWVYEVGLYHGKFLGENIKPFLSSPENFLIFKQGCKEMARLLEIYIDMDDNNSIDTSVKPFGKLTYEKTH